MRLNERYVVDEHGKKMAVMLDMEAYRQLMERLENLEDALELDQAVRESKGFRSYDEIRGELGPAEGSTQAFEMRFSADDIDYWAQRYVDGSTSRNWRLEEVIEETIVPVACKKGYLDRVEFLTICEWKTPRQRRNYAQNDEETIKQVTRAALSTSDERMRIDMLSELRGVQWPGCFGRTAFLLKRPIPDPGLSSALVIGHPS